MEEPGKRRGGTPKRMCLDNISSELSERELSGEVTQRRAKRRQLMRNIDHT